MPKDLQFDALIVAGGRGERAGLSLPKQYALLSGMPVLRWSVEAFARHHQCRSIIVIVAEGEQARASAILRGLDVRYAIGGATRQASVAAGLALLSQTDGEAGSDVIMVHDAARPGLNSAMIDALLAPFAEADCAGTLPTLPVADTLARGDTALGETVDRDGLLRVQTPQAFRSALLHQAHSQSSLGTATDDAQMVRAIGGHIVPVPGSRLLDKITHQGDLDVQERLIGSGVQSSESVLRTAVGMGFDVHRLVAGDGLWLGGVFIDHSHALLGHSDADVVLHAITDALLGAIGDGDIGSHFPPSDERWQGASSDQFLHHAKLLAQARGARLDHVDCTIMCEAPKIGPHRDAIRNRIAEILGLALGQVSVKATTTERLGFTGRGEGIAAQAVVTIALPTSKVLT
jgi:2-C-methyl-D-erythritol 4-phosphate cytidylyltransferase/2-C-methyl-D-erythritol 2,4-cyclodiphosphate synthase